MLNFYESLKNKTVVVTGGAGGIGTALSKQLVTVEADLLLIDNNKDQLGVLQQDLEASDSSIVTVTSSLQSYEDCLNALSQAPSELIALVHLAGVFIPDSHDCSDHAVWDAVFSNNLTNARDICLSFVDTASEITTRRIVLTSSLAANRGSFDHYSYSAAKAGLIGLTRAFSRRFAPHVLVNCVAPGVILTEMPKRLLADRAEKIRAEIPLQRFGQPDEVASVIAFLISDAASYVSGQLINIDGGAINS